jgi:hypothetical protein
MNKWPKEVYQDIPVIGGHTYRVGAWVKTSSSNPSGLFGRYKKAILSRSNQRSTDSNKNFSFLLKWYDKLLDGFGDGQSNLIKVDVVDSLPINKSWTYLSGEFTAPTKAVSLRIYMFLKSGTAWFDDTEVFDQDFIPQNLISLNSGIKYQTMNGWPAAGIGLDSGADLSQYRDNLINKAILEMGLNRISFGIKSGAENDKDYYSLYKNGRIDYPTWRSVRYSTDNDDNNPNTINWQKFHFSELDEAITEFVIPFKQSYEALNGETPFINFTYIGFIGQNGAGEDFDHNDSEEYAEFILAAFLHMRNTYNLIPDTIELCLEPEWGGRGGGTKWNGAVIGKHLLATAEKLEENGFTPKFIVPSVSFIKNAIPRFDEIVKEIGESNVRKYIEEFCYHLYQKASDSRRRKIAERISKYGIKSSMLEAALNDGGNGTPDQLHKDLKLANVSAWKQFALGYPSSDNGGAYYYFNKIDYVLHLSRYARYFPLYFRYVKNGAIRIEANTANDNYNPIAFINPDGGFTVIVRASTGGKLFIQGLPSGIYGIKYTTEKELETELSDQKLKPGQILTTYIPSDGVLTVFAKKTL